MLFSLIVKKAAKKVCITAEAREIRKSRPQTSQGDESENTPRIQAKNCLPFTLPLPLHKAK